MSSPGLSGTASYNPPLSEIGLEAFSRIQVRPAAITAQHMRDLRLSAQMMQSEWSNRVPNLWQVDQQAIPLVQGVSTYSIPQDTITILDAFCRQFILNGPVDVTPGFTTTLNSVNVTIYQPDHGLIPGNWISVYVPVAVGGIIIQGFYQVQAVVDANNYIVFADQVALSSASVAGLVPYFTTTANTPFITVTMTNHGLFAGNTFTIQVETSVGGQLLSGIYPVTSVTDANNFVIQSSFNSGTNDTGYENAGQTQILPQSNSEPQDRVIPQISRTNYNNQPNKFQQDFPTTFWYNRQLNPVATFWPVPDGNGPYVFYYYRLRQPQDAVLPNGVTVDAPYRFYDAYAAGLASRLARKYAPQLAAELKAEAMEAFELAASQDVELVPWAIQPILDGYYR